MLSANTRLMSSASRALPLEQLLLATSQQLFSLARWHECQGSPRKIACRVARGAAAQARPRPGPDRDSTPCSASGKGVSASGACNAAHWAAASRTNRLAAAPSGDNPTCRAGNESPAGIAHRIPSMHWRRSRRYRAAVPWTCPGVSAVNISRGDSFNPGTRNSWIVLRQDEKGGPAALYVARQPVLDPLLEETSSVLSPCLASVQPGLHFSNNDTVAGPWHSFYVGISGELSLDEESMQWPNQVIHGERTMHNLRSMQDLVTFLADASKNDVREHLSNLVAVAQDRGYSRSWCWDMLRARWGRSALQRLGVARCAVVAFGDVEGKGQGRS